MRIDLKHGRHISPIVLTDRAAYLEHLQEKTISEQTLNIPYPYREKDADYWLSIPHPRDWAIREASGLLIGGIGFLPSPPQANHRAELGYWLAKPFWNLGIATEAVSAVCDFGFAELALLRIEAHVFSFNLASCRVLEKAGFQFEGLLRQYHRKDSKCISSKLFAKIS